MKINNDYAKKLSCFKLEDYNDDELNLLRSNGFIVPKQLSEYKKLVDNENASKYEKGNLSYVIAPTLFCNYQCSYCFENSMTAKSRMSYDVADDVWYFITKQLDVNKASSLSVTWFGGEPLLEKKIIIYLSEKFVKYCKEKGIIYNARIITNGYFLNESTAVELSKLHVKHVQITLDGNEKIYESVKKTPTGAYKKVINNILSACKYMFISIRINATKDNYNDMNDFVIELNEYFNGYNNIRVYFAEVCDDWSNQFGNKDFIISGIRKEKEIFDNKIKSLGLIKANKNEYEYTGGKCGLMKKRNCVIGPEGELYRCEHLLGHREHIIGTCLDGLYHNVSDSIFDYYERPKKCEDCWIFPICMTGCPKDMVEGKFDRIDCTSIKNEVINYYINKYYSKISDNKES